jgi:peptidoglycan/xylan/chitin deacetylase (PgdA/CDA1 family)
MTPRLWITALVAAALVVGAVGAAQTLPKGGTSSTAPSSAQVLGSRVARHVTAVSSDPVAATAPRTAATSATSASSSPSVTSSTSTTTAPPPAIRPGPMAATSPRTPVRLSGTTPVIDHVPTDQKVIFLGVDDGLVRDPELIELLREERIPLTLFITSEPAKDGRDFFRALETLGSTVQDHTVTHPKMTTLGWSDQQKQVCNAAQTITANYGHRPTLFRPPYGEWNSTTQGVVGTCGMKAVVLWRGATNDGRLDIVGDQFHPGDILLMHFRKDLIQNLHLVLQQAREQGYRIGRLEDWIGVGPPHPMFPRIG